ncbi:ABC transporter substrate-binding protein [Ruicaihuangia caeni]|uniref:ABC transporter substrate-binding protein n=1 Tax=Ruicaihuangia caeni TaxID=3042517 RepID=A0AAW6T810_9MICO|nr:ABC transporter substrate-binding protein [Klugiella sp. YN-L-19]MDI2099241.1 ABC transporter substrate-binding protein [Klugiella sp. YN-L-19]
MKKQYTVVLGIASLSALVLAGCASTAPGNTAGESDDSLEMTLITGSGGPYYEALSCGAKKAATELGIELSVQFPPAWDPIESTSLLNAATSTKPDAIVVVPTDQTVLVAPIQQAVDAGITVVTVDQTLDEADAHLVASAVATDNEVAGAEAADVMAELIGGKGTVLVDGAAPGSSAADQRTNGFLERMASEHPQVNVLEVQYSNSDPAKATQIVNAALAANSDLAGVYVVYQDGVIGAGTALRASERGGEIVLVGFDTAPAEVELLEEGLASALIAQQPAVMGYDAVVEAHAALTDGAVQHMKQTPIKVVTKDNLGEADVKTLLSASASSC